MSELETTFYAIVDSEVGETVQRPGGLFRMRKGSDALFLESYDPEDPELWIDQAAELAPYIFQGERGARIITREQAMRAISHIDRQVERGNV